MRRIYLIGYMGAGKTTLGAPIAEGLGWQFIDLDIYIENRRHKTVNELFDKYGEEKFRQIERDILAEVSTFENVVISTGGGTPCFYDNLSRMKESGLTLFLEVSQQVLFERLKLGRRKRPKLRDKSDADLLSFIQKGLRERLAFYEQADLKFNVDNLDSAVAIERSAKEIVAVVKSRNI